MRIVTRGTVYLPGQAGGFPPGTVLDVPDVAGEALIAAGQADPAPAGPDAVETPPA